MTLPVVPVHDPVAHPVTGSDLSPSQVAELEAEIESYMATHDGHAPKLA